MPFSCLARATMAGHSWLSQRCTASADCSQARRSVFWAVKPQRARLVPMLRSAKRPPQRCSTSIRTVARLHKAKGKPKSSGKVPAGQRLHLRFLLRREKPPRARGRTTRPGGQACHAPFGMAPADAGHPVLGHVRLRRNGHKRQLALAQSHHLAPALLLRRRWQLAHIHVNHLKKLGGQPTHPKITLAGSTSEQDRP